MLNAFRKLIWEVSSRTGTFKGKERLISLISRPRGAHSITIARDGVVWLIHGHDLNEFAIAARKNHSSLLSERLNEEITKSDCKVFWDIGANIGAISLPLLKRNDGIMAVLFEPSAEVAGRLIKNVANNPSLLRRAMIMNIALSDSEGLANFYASNESFNSGTAGLGMSHNRFQFPVAVQAYTGDNLIATGKCPIPQLIKIDVEGFEIETLRGLSQTLMTHHPVVIFEHSLYRLNERGLARDEVVRFLESVGYAIYRLSDDKPVGPADLDGDADFIARAV